MVPDPLLHNAIRQRPIQAFTSSICLRRKHGRHRRGRHSAGLPSAIIPLPARTCHQLPGPHYCEKWNFLIKPYAHEPSKTLVATQSTSSNFVGRVPPGFCFMYVWHFVSLPLCKSSGQRSHMAIAMVLLMLPSLASSAASATILVTLLGFPWAIAQWAPFSLVCLSHLFQSSAGCSRRSIIARRGDPLDARFRFGGIGYR